MYHLYGNDSQASLNIKREMKIKCIEKLFFCQIIERENYCLFGCDNFLQDIGKMLHRFCAICVQIRVNLCETSTMLQQPTNGKGVHSDLH